MAESKISPLPGQDWSVKAALIDLLDQVDDIQDIAILYTRKDGEQYYQGANLLIKDLLWMLEQEKLKVLGVEK